MKVDKPLAPQHQFHVIHPICCYTLFVTSTVRQTVFADDPSSGRLNTQHSYLLMLSQWRISATNRRKGAWSRAFVCGAQIKLCKRRIACVLRCALTTVRRSKDQVCIGMTLCMYQRHVTCTLNHCEFIKNLSWEISTLIFSEHIFEENRTKNG
jgi:hypothetical protein